jgi:hypothetical protein
MKEKERKRDIYIGRKIYTEKDFKGLLNGECA